jgi:recombination protein RecA
MQSNSAKDIFDHFSNKLMPMVQDGLPLRMWMIDSVKAIRGPKEEKLESVEDHVMGDLSILLGKATKSVVGDIRQQSIATILIQQVNEEMDPAMAKYQSKWKIPNGQALKHFVDIQVLLERVNAKDSKIFNEESEVQLGHTVRANTRKNRVGAPFRTAEFQLQYGVGVVNQHVEVAGLAIKLGIVERPSNIMYGFGGASWRGRPAFEAAIKASPELQAALMTKIMGVSQDPTPAEMVDDLVDENGNSIELDLGDEN